MKAVIVREYGDVNELQYKETEQPQVAAGEVLVRIRATSVNPLDWKMRSGEAKEQFPMHFPQVLGVDIAGDVEQAGPGVTGFQKGMRVMAMGKSSYAQLAAVSSAALAVMPDELSYEKAGALPLVLTTGAELVERAANVQRGQTILITGAVGSVGRVAVHVAKQRGAQVLAGVRASQRKQAEELGAAKVIALDQPEELTQLRDLDAIADTVGGKLQAQVLPLLRNGGVYASLVGPPSQDPGRGIQVQAMVAKPDAQRLAELTQDVARGALVLPVARTFPLSEIQEATRLAEDGGAEGKVVLLIP